MLRKNLSFGISSYGFIIFVQLHHLQVAIYHF